MRRAWIRVRVLRAPGWGGVGRGDGAQGVRVTRWGGKREGEALSLLVDVGCYDVPLLNNKRARGSSETGSKSTRRQRRIFVSPLSCAGGAFFSV